VSSTTAADASGNDLEKNVRTKRTMRTKPAGRVVMEIMPGNTRPGCRVSEDLAVLSAEGSGGTVVRSIGGMAVKRMVTLFGSRLCAFSVAGDGDFLRKFGARPSVRSPVLGTARGREKCLLKPSKTSPVGGHNG
jgi:hypothetical protein